MILFRLVLIVTSVCSIQTYAQESDLEAYKRETRDKINKLVTLAEQGKEGAEDEICNLLYNVDLIDPKEYGFLKWCSLSADNRNTIAYKALAFSYKSGYAGAVQSNDEAFRWYLAAAQAGDVSSAYNVGMAYKTGKGVEKNAEFARKWLRLAAANNHVSAQMWLVDLNLSRSKEEHDFTEDFKWCSAAADGRGSALVQYNLARLYEYGLGIKVDYVQALKWYKLSATVGVAMSVGEEAEVKGRAAASYNRRVNLVSTSEYLESERLVSDWKNQ